MQLAAESTSTEVGPGLQPFDEKLTFDKNGSSVTVV